MVMEKKWNERICCILYTNENDWESRSVKETKSVYREFEQWLTDAQDIEDKSILDWFINQLIGQTIETDMAW